MEAPILMDSGRCDLCDGCNAVCPTNAIHVDEEVWRLIVPLCISCDRCVVFCPTEALTVYKEA